MDPVSAETDRIDEVLRAAGWFPGRDVGRWADGQIELMRKEGFAASPAAFDALREFGGLHVEQYGTGHTLAREPFRLEPTVASGERDRFERFEPVIGEALFPIGECGGSRFFLGIAPDGRVFAILDAISLVGGTAREAIANLIVGMRGAEIDPSGHGQHDLQL